MDAGSPGNYTVSNSAGVISIVRNDGSAPVAITNADANATAAAFGNQTGAITTNASFQVDGNAIVLNQDYTGNLNQLATDLQTQLNAAAGAGAYTVTNNSGTLLITNNSLGSPAVTIAGADPNAIAAGITNGAGVAGLGAGSITLAPGDFTITVPPGTTVDLAGTYASTRDFAGAINNNVSGVFAQANPDGSLSLLSAREFTLGGLQANGLLGFVGTNFTPTSGNLTMANVLTPENADEVIIRVDSALTSVSGLRSNFGAIQNRFESTINNLQTTSENLQASRSRILDADFAQETAELTRAQILQQAGVAILAQANQLPQNVLNLLR
ncbi:flagellin [Pseudomarimonas arenosa]